MTTELVLGPPGTGKTTYLVDQVREFVRHHAPDRVAFVSFTTSAIETAVTRIAAETKREIDDFPYCRTIHSLVYRALKLTRDDVFDRKSLGEFSESVGEPLTHGVVGERAMTVGDAYLRAVEVARATRQPLSLVWPEMDDVIPGATLYGAEAFAEAYAKFKFSCGQYDFHDMLDEYLQPCRAWPLDVDLAVIDEAQDLTTTQWRVVEKMFSKAKRIVIAGDDDQAIYGWAGADVQHFLSLGASVESVRVLRESHRLPRTVHAEAVRVASNITHRYAKSFHPREAGGHVAFAGHVEATPFAADDTLVLARNAYLLDDVERRLQSEGVVYAREGRSSVNPADVATIRTWLEARTSDTFHVDGKTAKAILIALGRPVPSLRPHAGVRLADLRVDVRQPWPQAFEGWSQARRDYYCAVLSSGRRLSADPKVTLSTIHAAKGAEKEHVVLLTDVSARTGRYLHTDAEWRVCYVGVTRAIETLHVVAARGQGYRW